VVEVPSPDPAGAWDPLEVASVQAVAESHLLASEAATKAVKAAEVAKAAVVVVVLVAQGARPFHHQIAQTHLDHPFHFSIVVVGLRHRHFGSHSSLPSLP
jgi:16S rRNA G1207 methylase RsmC